MGNAKFIENCGNTKVKDIIFEEESIGLPTMITTVTTNSERIIISNTIRVINS